MARAILLSIKPTYSLSIQNGLKRVEIRKKFPINSCGMKVFIYSTKPIGAIIGYFIITYIELLPIWKLWGLVQAKAHISKEVFYNYFKFHTTGYGIFFDEYYSLNHSISLGELRNCFPEFSPPQNYRYINSQILQQCFLPNYTYL